MVIEAVPFFSLDSLKAGWYLFWRMALMLAAPILMIVVLVAASSRDAVPVIFVLGGVAFWVVAVMGTNAVAKRWARRRWGQDFQQGVWWGITWREFLANLPIITATVLSSFLFGFGSGLDIVASLLLAIVSIQAGGWAMSIMVARRLAALLPAGVARTSVIL